MTPRTRLGLLALMTAALTGCHGGLHVPDDWVATADAPPVAPQALQVILCFGPVTSNHSVLRLQGAGDVVFWDPGGMYGGNERREHDRVIVDPPTAEQFWTFRRDATGETFHLVYEWDLTSQRAAELRAMLTDPKTFETARPGGGCCKAICEFFQKDATDLAAVPKRWLFPHALARHLWSQPVDRVRVYSKRDEPRVYVRKAGE